MRGMALEGGGARGAYHIGVYRAFLENGYEFNGFVGTSIGAINAALLAQGDFERAHELWTNISMEQIFDEDELQILRLVNHESIKFDAKLPSNIKKAFSKIIEGRGVDTSKMKAYLENYIDEKKLRAAKNDFGLVTVSFSERKPRELMLEDIPEGELVSYIMASASFPGFQPETIDDNSYLDGGLYNNCPINLLEDRGYDEIVAVRTSALGLFRKIEGPASVTVVTSRDNLGSIMLFTGGNGEELIRQGYYDGLRSIKNLRGTEYYISPFSEEDAYNLLLSIDDGIVSGVGRMLGAPDIPARRMLFEQIVPQLGAFMRLEKEFDYVDFVVGILENAAIQRGVERFKVYDFGEFRECVTNAAEPPRDKSLLEMIPGGLLTRKKTAAELFAIHLLSAGK